ncbi:MAG: hypothetical protein M1833_003092 [Piccolia ochrophora]|nr:MAG: hypothetical protein M1833_003092 [Piccolia ochrophora]
MNPPVHPSLLAISDELLLHVFDFLDIPELLATSRTCHRLRSIALDPILHSHRLSHASITLSQHLPLRPALSSLHPPTSTIYLTRTHLAARALSRSLISIRLNRSLSRRPPVATLVTHNILPPECCRPDPRTGEVVYGSGLAPSLVGARRSVERERVKDRLRTWVGERRRERGKEVAEARGWVAAGGGWEEEEEEGARGRESVRSLVRRFAGRARGLERRENRWDRAVRERKGGRDPPPRAHVLGLRRFWERVGKEGVKA